MTRSSSPEPVMVIDFRTAEGKAFLDTLNPRTADDLGLASNVLVIDTTTELTDHHRWFEQLALLPQITRLILLAVGPLTSGAATPRLSPPSSLQGLGVVLWAGDERGVLWAGGSQPPGARHGRMTVEDLITALRLPAVFKRVLEEVRQMPHQVAAPGLEVDHAAVDSGLLRTVKVRSLRQLTATGVSARTQDRESTGLTSLVTGTTRPSDQSAGIRPGSEVHELGKSSGNRISAVTAAVRLLGRARGLLGGARTNGTVPQKLASAATALSQHHDTVQRLLDDIDSSLAEGYPPATELVERGLPAPEPVNAPELAEELRTVFTAELMGGRTLPGLAEQARSLGNRLSAARGGLAAGEGAAIPPAEPIVRRLMNPPAFVLWPVPVAHCLPAVFLTCLAAGWLPLTGFVVGGLVALCWLGAVAMVFAAAPTRTGPPVVPLVLVGLLGVTAAAAGVFLPGTVRLGYTGEMLVTAVMLAGVVGAAAWMWRVAAAAWARGLQLERAAALSRQLVTHIESVAVREWTSAEHNRRLADSLFVISGALDAISDVFSDVAGFHHTGDGEFVDTASVDMASDLVDVLRHDLVSITLAVLRPCFNEISSRAPLSNDRRRFTHRAREMVAEYNDHLENVGLRELPPGVADDGPRRQLAATLWRGSEVGRRILQSNGRSQMTQLCAAADVKLLHAGNAVTLHFASWDADVALSQGGEVIRTGGDAVGVLRLTPLKAGLVEWSVGLHSEEAGA
jgi:hypothetical protein